MRLLLTLLGITACVHSSTAAEMTTQPVVAAIRANDVAAMEKILTEHPQLAATKDDKGRSVVLMALLAVRGEGFSPPPRNALLQSLLKRKPPLDFFETCGIGNAAAVRKALESDPSLATSWHPIGWSALHFAAFSGDTATTQLILDHGGKIEARARTRFINTPLQVALLPGQFATTKLLLEKGADPLARQNAGGAPIHEAALLGRRDLVDLLLEKGAEINSRANDGRTAVSEALRGGHADLAAYLRSRGGVDASITADVTKAPE